MEQTTPTQSSNQPVKNNNVWTWVVLIAIPVIILVYIAMNRPATAPESQSQISNNSVMEENINSMTPPINEVPEESGMISSYKDGTYEAEGDYVSPGGPEQVGLKLTLKDGVVTDSTFTPMAERPMSVNFQGQFAEGYKEFVVGKRLDEINITKVSGSSLTPQGFHDALAKIKAEATL